jgi:hypothetical protein
MSPSTQTLNVLSQHDATGGGDLRYDFSQLDNDASATTHEQMSTTNRQMDTASQPCVTTNQEQDTTPRPSVTTDLPVARVNYQQAVNAADRPVIKTNPQGAKKAVATNRKKDTTTTNPKVDTATRPSVTTDFVTKDLPVVKTNAQGAKKDQPAVKKQQVARSEKRCVERANHQLTDLSVGMANHIGTNAKTDEPDVKKQRVKRKDPPLVTKNQHAANHRQQVDRTVTDSPIVTANKQDTTTDQQVDATNKQVDSKSRQVIVKDPKEDYKDWVKLSFSLPDPGSLGIVIKKLHLTNRTYALVKAVKAGSQAETAGVVAGDVVVVEYEEALKWSNGPRPICFFVLRKPPHQVVQLHCATADSEARQAVAAPTSEHGMHGEADGRHIVSPENVGMCVETERLASQREIVNGGGQNFTDMPGQVRRWSICNGDHASYRLKSVASSNLRRVLQSPSWRKFQRHRAQRS